jgi:hypothetical protein
MFRAIHLPSSGAQEMYLQPLVLHTFFGYRPLQWLNHRKDRQPKTYVKLEAAITVLELLMMGGVSHEIC